MWLIGLLACGGAGNLDVGLPHRPAAVECVPVQPDEPATCQGGGLSTCTQHADCGSGWCLESDWGCGCAEDECVTDDDCLPNQTCACGADIGVQVDRCLEAECRVDSDCASGLCLADRKSCSGPEDAGVVRWFCATDRDTCRSDEVCTGDDDLCVYDYDDEHFACSDQSYRLVCD